MIVRERHPFEGHSLVVMSAIKRRGTLLLLVVLPDGSRSLIPASWTDWALILGLATRVGATVLFALTVASHVRVAALDLNLFWMALLAYYILLGADRLSLDRLLSQGLKNSPLPHELQASAPQLCAFGITAERSPSAALSMAIHGAQVLAVVGPWGASEW